MLVPCTQHSDMFCANFNTQLFIRFAVLLSVSVILGKLKYASQLTRVNLKIHKSPTVSVDAITGFAQEIGIRGCDVFAKGCLSLTRNKRSDETRSLSCNNHIAVVFRIENVLSFSETSTNVENFFLHVSSAFLSVLVKA